MLHTLGLGWIHEFNFLKLNHKVLWVHCSSNYSRHICFYRTLHCYNLIWAVCHLFPQQRWWTHTYSVTGNHWPGEQRDMLKTTSCIWSHLQDTFSINTSSSNTLSLFYPISSQWQHTPSSVNQQEWKATTCMGLADIQNIYWLWDFFQSQRNRLFPTIKRKTF